MQKKLIALAIAAAISAPAFADTDSTTLYGVLDYGMLNQAGQSGVQNPKDQGKTSFHSGISAGSRLGFKGSEDLGNGYKAIFELEYGINIDNNNSGSMGNGAPKSTASGTAVTGVQSAPFWNRHSYVGITGDTGTFVGGRLEGDRYGVSVKFDPFAGGTVGNFGSLIGNQARADNAVAYISPNFSGFSALVAYSNNLTGNEASGNVGDARLYAIRPEYNAGPVDVLLNYEAANVKSTGGDLKIFDVAGSYDFGVVKVMGMYDTIKSSAALAGLNLDQKSYLIGAVAPVTESIRLKASFASVKDDQFANNSCKKTSIGADYSMSKRTSFYADFATIKNDSLASCSIATSAAAYSGSNAAFKGGLTDSSLNQTGFGTRGFDIGLKHTF